MFGLDIGGSKSSSKDDSRGNSNDVNVSESGVSNISNVDASGKHASVYVTDSGAISGSVSVANNALRTTEAITKNISDSSLGALQAVKGLASKFGSSVESIKKAELTGGSSLLHENLKYWPIVPVAFVAVAVIKKWGKKNG